MPSPNIGWYMAGSKAKMFFYNIGLYGVQCSMGRFESNRGWLAALLREQKDKPKRSPYEDKAGRWF